jgi:hypothetical protein
VLFRKNRKPPPPVRERERATDRPKAAAMAAPATGLYRIDHEMLVKGSIVTRKGKPIRQFGVTVGGSTRLVTSGDVVDQATYEALRAAGALRAAVQEPEAASPPGGAHRSQ